MRNLPKIFLSKMWAQLLQGMNVTGPVADAMFYPRGAMHKCVRCRHSDILMDEPPFRSSPSDITVKRLNQSAEKPKLLSHEAFCDPVAFMR